MNIEALIPTVDNETGLTALLWSIFNGTKKPDQISIFYCSDITDRFLVDTLNYIGKFIPIKLVGVNRVTDEGYGVFWRRIFDKICLPMVWVLNDDQVVSPNCLEKQLEKFTGETGLCPNVPVIKDLSFTPLPDEIDILYNFGHKPAPKNYRLKRGSIIGLLTNKDELSKESLPKLTFFLRSEDDYIISVLKPYLVSDAVIYSPRHVSNHTGELARLVGKLIDTQK